MAPTASRIPPMTIPAVEVPNAAPSRRATYLTVGFVLLVALLFWAFDGWLLLRLRVIANEAFTREPARATLTVDVVDELDAYPPRRLARFLSVPSVQVRHVVYVALSSRRRPCAPEEWVGVLPALVHAHRQSKERAVDRASGRALFSLPLVPRADVECVFEFSDAQLAAADPEWQLAGHLLETAAKSHPDLLPRVLQTVERLVPRMGDYDLEQALQRLNRMAPESPEAAAVLRRAALTAPVATADNSPMNAILRRQPALIDELLGGTWRQQLAVIALAAAELSPSMPGDARARTSWLTPDRLERIKRAALSFLADGVSRDAARPAPPGSQPWEHGEYGAVLWFLVGAGDHSELLFEEARRSTDSRRRSALYWTNVSVTKWRPKEMERFYEGRLPELISWLEIDDESLQKTVLDAFTPVLSGLMSGRDPRDDLKRFRAGADAPLVAVCRRLLDKHPGRHDYTCLAVLADATPDLDARDVDRVAEALERALVEMKKGYERSSQKPQGSLADLHRRLYDRLSKHQARPAVRRALELRRELEAAGILGERRPPR